MYIPHSEDETREILSFLGLGSLEDLFSHIDPDLLQETEGLPPPRSEEDLRRYFKELAGLNRETVIFAGGGAYDRIIPSVIWEILSRGEFLTAYTPYQAEASQGTLQAIFEYQSLICELTAMEVANASMYDGASALAEGVLMAGSIKGTGSAVLLSEGINPFYRDVVKTYLQGHEDEIRLVPLGSEGTTDLESLRRELEKGGVYAVVVQYPNFLGYVEDLKEVSALAKEFDALLVVSADPIALTVLKPPGEFGADIVTGEGQQLGVPLNFGGPYVGFFATREEYVRKMPGRLVGMAEDLEGKRAYTLILQTREQHIRRERATSNICTNQNLLALANLIYMNLLGAEGMREVAVQSLSKALMLKEGLLDLGFKEVFSGHHLWEFPLSHPRSTDLRKKLLKRGFLFGLEIGRWFPHLDQALLIAVTEKRTEEEIEALIRSVKDLL